MITLVSIALLSIEPDPAGTCVVPVNNCVQVKFTADNITDQTGVNSRVFIDQEIFDAIQDGSTITMAGATFTFVTSGADPLTNTVLIGPTVEDTKDNLGAAVQANFALAGNIDSVLNTAGLGLTIFSNSCDFLFEVEALNLDEDPNIQVNDILFPLVLKPNYSVIARITSVDKCFSKELKAWPIIELTCDRCEIDQATIQTRIDGILRQLVFTPLPSIETGLLSTLHPRLEMICDFTLEFGEMYGLPTNIYKLEQIGPYTAFAGGFLQGGKVDFGDIFCKQDPEADFVGNLITIYEDEAHLYCDQLNWVYYWKYFPEDPITNARLQVELFSISGTSLGVYDFFITLLIEKIIEIPVGLPQIIEHLQDAGFSGSIGDIRSYSIQFSETNAGGEQTHISEKIRFNVKPASSIAQFVFLSYLGTFTSLPAQPIRSSTLEAEREFIQACLPCDPATSDRQKRILCVDQYIELSTNLFEVSTYQERVLREFFGSSEVYWVNDGKLYSIEPISESLPELTPIGTLNPEYTFRLNKYIPNR